MRIDRLTLEAVEDARLPPTLRFFRFQKPTLSYGRLQKWNDVAPRMAAGWEAVQRPTGGGLVFHENDFCFSLAWGKGQKPIPERPQDQYRWIHARAFEVLTPQEMLRMAACNDVSKAEEPFSVRSCFTNPVGFDLLRGAEKILGGALRCTRSGTLYQGSIQHRPISPVLENRLAEHFLHQLNSR